MGKAKRNWLRVIRWKHGYTQDLTAKKAGIHRSSYTHIENGRRNPSVNTAQKIAKVLEFDWTLFFNQNGGETPHEEGEK